jgi:hypothetical protein
LRLTPYSISTGLREDKRGWKGNKSHYFLSDVNMPIRDDGVCFDYLIVLFDVDYYVSRETFEQYAGFKIVIFTVDVNAVGGSDSESFWYIDGDIYTEHIAGGATWKHQVWNYDGANCIIRDLKRDGKTGVVIEDNGYWMYHIERRRFPGTNKMLVFLNPQYHCRYPWELVKVVFGQEVVYKQQLFNTPTVTRHISTAGEFRIAEFGGSHPYVSFSYATPTRFVVKLPLDVWQGLITRRKLVTVWGCEVVRGYLANIGHVQPPDKVNVIAAILATVPESISFVGYTADEDPFGEVANVARLTTYPPFPPATASAQTVTDILKATKTLETVRNTVEPTREMRDFAIEFAREVGKRAKWFIEESEETLAAMVKNNPARKAGVKKFMNNLKEVDTVIRANLKAEAIPDAAKKGKNARMILPQDDYELFLSGRIFRPWAEAIHKDGEDGCGHFYVCGSSPDVIADHVVNAVRAAYENGNVLVATDFSKFDLHHSPFTRQTFVEAVALGCGSPEGAKYVRMVLGKEINKLITFTAKVPRNHPNPGKLPAIKSGYMNLSGAADTTALNTFTNALISYLTMRRLGYNHERAFKDIRPKYGDDGLEEYPDTWTEVAKELGFTGTVESRISNYSPIDFLSRVYVNPMLTNSSICEPKRAMAKLPVTCSSDPLDIARYNKAKGYYEVDKKTPLVGEFAGAIMRVYGAGKGTSKSNKSEDRELAYKIARGPHPFHDCDLDLAVTVVADRLGMTNESVEELAKRYADAQTEDDMKNLATQTPSEVSPGCHAL